MAKLEPVPTGTTHLPGGTPVPPPYETGADLLGSITPRDLVYYVLNVGDADTQLLVLPEDDYGVRHMIVVDVGTATRSKLPDLVGKLMTSIHGGPALLTAASTIKLLVATHPHADHIGGVPDLFTKLGPMIAGGEIWDPAYFHTATAWHGMMHWLERHPEVARLHPTAGTRRHIGGVSVTALSPAVRLRNHFDTYGVHVNNASIALLVEFPVSRVFTGDVDTFASGRLDRGIRRQALLLGADAQTTSWSSVDVDFPSLARDHDPRHRLLGQANGTHPLRAAVFKVPHHCSKHGLNLELVERVRPKLSIISCGDGRGRHGFPHDVALTQLREAVEAVEANGRKRKPLWHPEVNIITTADRLDDGRPLGSIAVVMSPTGGRQIFRLGDAPTERITTARLRDAWRKR